MAGVKQTGNRAGGHIVGGDFVSPPESKSALRRMAEGYRNEVKKDSDQQEFIEELQDYMKRVQTDGQRTLEQKLAAADRNDLISRATLLKELFAKKLTKHTFSPCAQTLFVHILAAVNCAFHQKVKPLIREGCSPRQVDKAIYDEILASIYFDVGDSQLGVTIECIHGMLFYLTGNCYIDWDM